MAITLTAQQRAVQGKKVAQLRQEKQVPAVLYGEGVKENQNLQVAQQDFQKVYDEAGEFQVVELSLGQEKPFDVLIREVQIDPVTRAVIHTDFQAIDANKEVDVEIPLRYVGEAPAVKASGGSLIKNLSAVSVRCLPKNLVKEITVPLAKLETLDDIVLVRDLVIPEGLEVLLDEGDAVASVVPPKLEAEPVQAGAEEEAPAEGEAEKKGTEAAEGESKE